MSGAHFLQRKLDGAIEKSKQLSAQSLLPMATRRTLPQVPAVYVLYEAATPVHVGRCKKLRDRINGQCAGTLESSSFAFKQTRKRIAAKRSDESYLTATYTTKGSRKELFARPYFRAEFDQVISEIKDMNLRFLKTDDDIEQYLLELVVAHELSVSMDEFRTT